MQQYLQQLLKGEINLESDEELAIADEEVIQGDIPEAIAEVAQETVLDDQDAVEEGTITEVVIEKIEEDQTTLESLIVGMKAAIDRNGSLTTEGALFASNHVQSIVKRYGIEFAPQVTTESFQANAAASSRLTLEAAEGAEQSLWERFKQMMKAALAAISNFFASLFKTASHYKRIAESIISRAQKLNSGPDTVEVSIKGKNAMLFNSLGAIKEFGSGKLDTSKFTSNAVEIVKFAKGVKDTVTKIKAIDVKTDSTESEVAVAFDAATKTIFEIELDLPFGKSIKHTKDTKKFTIIDSNIKTSSDEVKVRVSAADVKALANAARAYINVIDVISDAYKAFGALTSDLTKKYDKDTGKVGRWFNRLVFNSGASNISSKIGSITKSAAAGLLSVAGDALKKLENIKNSTTPNPALK